MKSIVALFLILLLFGSACTPAAQVAPVPAIEVATRAPTSVPTLTLTAIALPTATQTPTNTPTIPPHP